MKDYRWRTKIFGSLSILGISAVLLAVLILLSMSFGIIDESSITTEISLALLQFGTISTLLISPPTLNWFVQDYRANKIDTEQKFAAIDKSSLVAYFHPNGTIKHMNANLTRFLGWQANELNGQSHQVICPRHVYRSEEYQTCWKHLAQGKPAKGTFLRITKHGDYKYLYCSYNPILDVSGRVVEIMKIANDVTDEMAARQDLQNKNTYLEHAAKILRHDMHSGINTYIPRGISALKRRISDAKKKELRIEAPFRLLEEGLEHTQRVYRGVKEFTNLVRKDVKLEKQEYDLREILVDYLSSTAYKDQVAIDRLPIVEVNEPLFCTAIDNLIRNGLKYNDSEFKMVAITMLDEQTLGVIDNGRGLTQEDFEQYSKPYLRKKNQTESGTGLGLNISIAILKEHGFTITSFHDPTKDEGTILRIKIK